MDKNQVDTGFPIIITKEEQNKIIREKLGIKRISIEPFRETSNTGHIDMGYKAVHHDLFTPDGQAIIMENLFKEENKELLMDFVTTIEDSYFRQEKSTSFIIIHLLGLIQCKETKLAELFYEFIESEKVNG